MTSETDGSTAVNTWELTCSDCAFETSVEGAVFDALDVADAHQEEHGDTPGEHFVNFELTGPD